jgi:hypothetical protein
MPNKLKVIELMTADVFQDMVRVHQKHRPNVPAGRICRMTCGQKSVLVVARGARHNRPNSAAIDLRTRNRLGLSSYGQEIEVSFERANSIDEMLWGWSASEPVSRIATRLGVLSLALGVLGTALGVIAVFK